uniref:Uncharacterized protein n=1 Tax=Panagrolaimus sp. ES5 TaxID=591445 RepID=A0AC34F2B6_9BILA
MFGISRALNRDTAGAYGAAILAAQISNPNQQENKIPNFLSSSIGIGLAQNQYSIALKKGLKYPTQIKKRYFTSENEQKYAIINIYEGENLEASLNQKLFSFVIRDIPLCSKNEAFIDIIFKLDKYGIITVKIQNIQKTLNYHACNIVKEAGESIELFINELKIDPKNNQEKRNLLYARAQLQQNIIIISEKMNEMIKDDAINIEDETKKVIIKNCKIIRQWLKDNPDKKVEDNIIDLGKKIEKDAKDFIDLLAIS